MQLHVRLNFVKAAAERASSKWSRLSRLKDFSHLEAWDWGLVFRV